MNIGIVGLGLIGGSFCKAIKAYTENSVFGFDINPEVIYKAFLEKNIDGILNEETFSNIDVLLIALYPKATIKFIQENKIYFKNDLIVADCCGVKKSICEYGFSESKKRNFYFIGAHPMAGKEFSGYINSSANLYIDANMILIPNKNTPQEILTVLETLFKQLKFKNIKYSDYKTHDKIIACTSQLAHVVSSAYVKSETAKDFCGFSAGSFADMTRVAKLNENMWSELFFENKNNLIFEIENIILNLKKYKIALENDNYNECKELLKDGRIIKEKLLYEENNN